MAVYYLYYKKMKLAWHIDRTLATNTTIFFGIDRSELLKKLFLILIPTIMDVKWIPHHFYNPLWKDTRNFLMILLGQYGFISEAYPYLIYS
ncbi:hypothetical protein CFP56_041453 [Quercus suber]|uniref:Uncharacterized protein n=1 Tax=Quercus suber TaxID=58331 RepID=A0AAW0LKT1_QUESU